MLRATPSLHTVLLSPAPRDRGTDGTRAAPAARHKKAPRAEAQTFKLTSDSFDDDGVIPERLAGAHGVSPQLTWANAPRDTDRFVIIMDDPDARPVVGHTFVHWVAALPGDRHSLKEGASAGGWTHKHKVLSGDGTSIAYRGPRPPSGTHRYHIAVYAMDGSFAEPDFQDLARATAANDTRTYTRERFESLFRAAILASAEISGTYRAAH